MIRPFILIGAMFLGSLAIGGLHADRWTTGEAAKAKGFTPAHQTPNSAAQVFAKLQVPVLCYHRITDARKGDYSVSPATFAAQMKILADSGYHAISPAQLYGYLVYNRPLPDRPVLLTFDDSRTEHASIAAPILERHGFRGVFFIMTITYNKKNYMTTAQIAQLAKSGHAVGLHSWDHTMVTRYKEAADWQKQVVDPKAKLEGITGKPVDCWAYPNGVYDRRSAEVLSRYFKLSFVLAGKRDSAYPLQSVRRLLVTERSPQSLLRTMRQMFGERHKTQDTRHKTQDARRKMQDARCKTQDSRHKTQDNKNC